MCKDIEVCCVLEIADGWVISRWARRYNESDKMKIGTEAEVKFCMVFMLYRKFRFYPVSDRNLKKL